MSQNPGSGSTRSTRTRSRARKWAFRIATVAIAVLCIGALEIVLRVAGVGENLELVIPAPGQPHELKWQFNERADIPFLATYDLPGPEQRRFDLPKPADVYRIVVLGESTVQGFPYPSVLGFPRQLELILQEQLPARRIEVLNAGVQAVGSFVVADLARQSLIAQPDLIVVHTGHNDSYSVGAAAVQTWNPPWLLRAQYAIRRLRLSQWYIPLAHYHRERSRILPKDLNLPLDSPAVARMDRVYRSNLQYIVDTAGRAGVPVLLTSVASNLRDQSPMIAAHSLLLSESDERAWRELVESGEAALQTGHAEQALSIFQEAERIDSHHARLLYREAQCLEALERFDEALAKYTQARDRDECRYRASSAFREIVREVVDTARSETVWFYDWSSQAESIAAPRAPGHDLFLDHVHYNFEGNYQLARNLAMFIQARVLQQNWNSEHQVSLAAVRTALRTSPLDEMAALSFALNVIRTDPCSRAVDSRLHQAFLAQEIATRLKALPQSDQAVFSALTMSNAVEFDLPSVLAREYLARGDTSQMLECSATAAVRRPWDISACLAYANALDRVGRRAEARAEVERARQLDRGSAATSALQKRLQSAEERAP